MRFFLIVAVALAAMVGAVHAQIWIMSPASQHNAGSHTIVPSNNDLLLEDGSSFLFLEDGASKLCLESGC